jgi:uncharacterized protein (TIRG00374 family)
VSRWREIPHPWLIAVQALLSVTLLGWLAWSIDWAAMVAALRGASPPLIGAGALLYFLGVALSCYKWQRSLLLEGIRQPLGRLLRWYLIGSFANNFMPSDIGGDLGRGYLAAQAVGRPLAVARSILAERLSGLAMMCALAWIGIGALLDAPTLFFWLSGGSVALGVGLLLALSVAPGIRRRLAAAAAWGRLPAKLRDGIAESAAVIGRARRSPGQLALILLLSLAFQLLAGLGLWLNLLALGTLTAVWPILLSFALANLISLLPISINGWGLREGALVALIAPLGVPSSVVLAGALYSRALVFGCTLVGAAPALLARQIRPVVAADAAGVDDGY